MFLRTFILSIIFTGSLFIAKSQGLEKRYLNNKTYPYNDLMAAYKTLANSNLQIDIKPWGMTDSGKELELVFIKSAKAKNKGIQTDSNTLVMLVLNGIHAGESCGVDASLHWAEKLAARNDMPENVLIIIVPVYNIGGALNASCCTRVNQNGPEIQGFRGNGQNLDLNRDFMKADSENTKSFQRLMQEFDPDVIMDTHSTNGADYQYTMTLIPYQFEKWPQPLQYVGEEWFSEVKSNINKKVKTSNYVNVWGTTPEAGFGAFEVTSIFSGGYAGLFRALNITSEAHMFKSYKERVEASIVALDAVLETSVSSAAAIKKARAQSLQADMNMKTYASVWKLDSTVLNRLDFEGYKAEFFTSSLTGQARYAYNREKPITFKTNYYPRYKAVEFTNVPTRYFLHQSNRKAIAMLSAAGVSLKTLQKDTLILVSVDYVSDLKYAAQPYEGHFPHQDFSVESRSVIEHFFAGDVVIETRQKTIRYILEALSPQTPGSFFRWNFFDAYLQQKEGFSAYIFEEKAIAFLDQNPAVKAAFDAKKAADTAFAHNAYAQLYWVYQRTPFFEKEFMRIPVFRVY